MKWWALFAAASVLLAAGVSAANAFDEADAMEVFEDAPVGISDTEVEEIVADDDDGGDDEAFLGAMDGVHLLEKKDESVRFPEAQYEELKVLCYKGYPADILAFWSSAALRLQIDGDDFEVFVGRNVSSVNRMYEAHRGTWFYSGLPWKTKNVQLNPFAKSCVGVATKERYSVSLSMYRINYWFVLTTCLGVALYVYAPGLCRNVFFHYTTGVAAGILLSLLALTYIVQRRLRSGWVSWIMACYSLALYALTSLWYNIKEYLLQNHLYVLAYFVVTGLASFAVCYRMGPVENPRTLNLIQWSLQLVALVLVYLSSYHQLASLSVAVALVLWRSVPDLHKAKARTWYRKRFFRPQVKLLTEAEFMDQSRIHTEKELEKLRQHCRSPQCNSWTVVSRLQSPTRFAGEKICLNLGNGNGSMFNHS